PSQVSIPGFAQSGTPPPAENQLIRVETAKPVETPAVVQVGKKGKAGAKPTPTPKGKLAKGKATPKPAASASATPAIAEKSASPTGGGTWKTFAPGKMPLGRLIGTGDLKEIADQGTGGERIYLKGQFVVNFSDANRAVLRPRGKLTDSVLHFGAAPTRIIV